MLESLSLREFTVFREADFKFASGLNVVVGANGFGKTHLLKLGYVVSEVGYVAHARAEEGRGTSLSKRIATKLETVFRPDSLGRLARRVQGLKRTEVRARFRGIARPLSFAFSTKSSSEVVIERQPVTFPEAPTIFLPTKEAISMFPGFAALYRDYHIALDETYYDLCLALERPLLKGRRYDEARRLLDPIEEVLGGSVYNRNGRFELRVAGGGSFEMPLVAEGLRKLATIAYLVANGSLSDKATLFWDEPETNLNPLLIRRVAELLVTIAGAGVQVILATHSLYLMRELDILLKSAEHSEIERAYFALGGEASDVTVSRGEAPEEIEPLVLLDAELEQSDRYLQTTGG